MAGPVTSNSAICAKLEPIADALVVATAVSLPWSTSATAILAVLWLLALIPTLQWADIRRELVTAPGGLPVLLFALGLAGTLWADVTLLERWKGLDSFFKLLTIPFLFAQFRRSDHGQWVFTGYLLSCIALLAVTAVVMVIPPLAHSLLHFDNVLMRNAATQSGEFVTCVFGLLYLMCEGVEKRRRLLVVGPAAIIFAMLADIFYASTGRTALAVAIVLLLIFAIKRLNPNGIVLVISASILVGVAAWYTSPYLRHRVDDIWVEIKNYETANIRTSSGERIEFWKKSIEFVRQSPIGGNGTGSIHSLFVKAAVGQTGPAGVAAANPHNQTLAVAIQLGLVGVLILWAMWAGHLFLFRGRGLAAWIGLVIVTQNIIGSLFNSHLFDFVQGWTYVFGVGVAGGMVLKARSDDKQK